ncbi:MAG: MFS transporter, partial [Anaerolineae bacterium]
MTILKNRLFLAVALGHTTTDIFNSAGPVLIVFLSLSLGLSNAQIGLAAALYTVAGSVGQPLFGWLGDRFGNRWLSGVGVLWVAGFMTLATVTAASGQFLWVLIPYTLAALGSAAFHPTGVASAGGTSAGRAATTTAMFFLFGQIGLASGPVLGGALLEHRGLAGLQMLALLAVPVSVFLLTAPHAGGHATLRAKGSEAPAPTPGRKIAWGALIVLAVLSATRSWAQLGTVNFLPKLFQNKGWDPTAYGAITGAMWFASAIMGVLAGQAADRWGRRQVIFTAMVASAVPLYLLPLADGWSAFPLA